MTPEPTGRLTNPRPFALLPTLIGIALLTLAVGARPGLAGLGAYDPHATATPTKTPRPTTPEAVVDVLQPAIVALTATPQPTPTAPAPAAAPTALSSEALSPYLAAIADEYDIDVSRRFVVVNPDMQRMTVWDPGKPMREFPVSTGDTTRGYRTPAWHGLIGDYWGTFNAFGVYADEGWYLYEDAGSILIHGAPYKAIDGRKVYEELDALGNYPASRGCIRLRPEDAAWFTEWQPKGVPLVILPKGTAAG